MPTTNYPGAGGINFGVTTTLGTVTTVTILHKDGTLDTYNSSIIPLVTLSAQIPTSPASSTVVSALGTYDYFDVPGVTHTYNILANLLGTTNIFVGGTATISNTISLGSALNIDVVGGNATYAPTAASVLAALNADIEDGGTFNLGTTSTLLTVTAIQGSTLDFGTGGGTLVLGNNASFINLNVLSGITISGFDSRNTDFIDDRAISFGAVGSYSVSASGGNDIITFFSGAGGTGTQVGSAAVAGTSLLGGTFNASDTLGSLTLSNDGSGGLQFTPNVLCFLGGTHIATTEGEKRVEELQMGDLVRTVSGELKPVRWIGVHTVAARDADPIRYLPVRIKAGALGEAMPARDLLVSPDHAMFIDGVLIQAGALVNGTSVVRAEMTVESFVYFHVEVEGHSLILAEGAATETFVDNADRMAFDNWAEYVALYGDDMTIAEMDFPRVLAARQIPAAIRLRLDAAAQTRSAELVTVAAS